jgi:mannose-6-phosphate isomerase-like protein (cupin superfamily)
MEPQRTSGRGRRPALLTADARAYRTKDGSLIRELAHPCPPGGPGGTLASRGLSLAEATVPPGTETFLHRHPVAEEVYHVLAGAGTMTLGGQTFPVAAGDTVVIAPGTLHAVANPGPGDLRILCVCVPAYSHDDTELAGPDIPLETP